jgi:hypothetical protein
VEGLSGKDEIGAAVRQARLLSRARADVNARFRGGGAHLGVGLDRDDRVTAAEKEQGGESRSGANVHHNASRNETLSLQLVHDGIGIRGASLEISRGASGESVDVHDDRNGV